MQRVIKDGINIFCVSETENISVSAAFTSYNASFTSSVKTKNHRQIANLPRTHTHTQPWNGCMEYLFFLLQKQHWHPHLIMSLWTANCCLSIINGITLAFMGSHVCMLHVNMLKCSFWPVLVILSLLQLSKICFLCASVAGKHILCCTIAQLLPLSKSPYLTVQQFMNCTQRSFIMLSLPRASTWL